MYRTRLFTTRRVLAVVAVSTSAVVGFVVPANAGNDHTVNGIYHGCGNCTGSYDYSIHPFTDYANSNFKRGQAYERSAGPLGGLSGDCYCSHAHMTWDTNPYPECRYSAYNAAASPNLNGHFHYYHGYSGYC